MAQFTKQAIINSFLKLLEETPLDKITVKDIVEDCGINRNTFYYYYHDIYALLEELFSDEIRRAMERFGGKFFLNLVDPASKKSVEESAAAVIQTVENAALKKTSEKERTEGTGI